MKQKSIYLLAVLLMLTLSVAAKRQTRAQQNEEAVPALSVMQAFHEQLQADPFLSDAAQQKLNAEIEQHIHSLLNWADKAAYVKEHNLQDYVDGLRRQMEQCKSESKLTIEKIQVQYGDMDAQQRVAYSDSMQAELDERLAKLEKNINRLDKEIEVKEESPLIDWDNLNWKTIGIAAGAVLLLIILLIAVRKRKKSRQAVNGTQQGPSGSYAAQRSAGGSRSNTAEPGIVVRRKTATILKKQSLEDVIDNPNYLQVDAIDFCYESAVRRMYIKNTCIIDIYNMYAEDLRNPNSPKEDGCMVLGRWVHDPESNEYYVSLEEIVLPGDDAVFEEYALNFGGKIKLKVLEQLRRLRRDTNLQYDLTCWVHSHPGLGVFFSNSDTSVQDQLKHPTHPNFLTAIVVDILTPMQDLGIFTFQRDTTINSKNDLKKMYSLIEWYQWAKESVGSAPKKEVAPAAQSLNTDDYFNTLANSRQHDGQCYAVQLGKNAVVDMCMALTDADSDTVAMIHGRVNQTGSKAEYLAEQVNSEAGSDKQSLVGCFLQAPHCSIPTVRRAVADHLGEIKFVLVYTPGDGLLTTIPVIDNDLCTEEDFYGEQKLEDLKNWIKKGR